MLIVQGADLKETPGVFIQKDGQDMLIINQNESDEKVGQMVKDYINNTKEPALAEKQALTQSHTF